jgi:hypothetical protein
MLQGTRPMGDFVFLRNVALYSALSGFLFALLLFGVFYQISIQMLLAASGLISVGATVVGVLVALSFTEEGEEEH